MIRFGRMAVAGALLTLAACSGQAASDGERLDGQQAPAGVQLPGAGPISETAQALIQEYQEIQNRLGQVEQEAMETDEALQERFGAVLDRIDAVVVEMDPGMAAKLERFDVLEGEFVAAQQAGDMDRIQALAGEAQQLQFEIQGAQSAAMEREDVAAEVDSFREQLLARMREIEPNTDDLLDRLETISRELMEDHGLG